MALASSDVPKWKRIVMYWTVRIFGWGNYRQLTTFIFIEKIKADSYNDNNKRVYNEKT